MKAMISLSFLFAGSCFAQPLSFSFYCSSKDSRGMTSVVHGTQGESHLLIVPENHSKGKIGAIKYDIDTVDSIDDAVILQGRRGSKARASLHFLDGKREGASLTIATRKHMYTYQLTCSLPAKQQQEQEVSEEASHLEPATPSSHTWRGYELFGSYYMD